MHTDAPAPKRFLAARMARRLSIVGLAAAMAAATGCHDAPTSPITPAAPALAVGSDGAWLVNSLADPGDGVCANNECTLREAIAAAQTGERITFKSNLSGAIVLNAGALVIDKSLTIDGPGADMLAVDGQNANRVFQIGTVVIDVVATLSGLTITHGNSGSGGGIFVRLGSRLGLIASVVTLNTGFIGGGIENEGRLTLVQSTITANRATGDGGGIANFADLTLNRSTISGNRADGSGGGIRNNCLVAPCESLTLRSSTITDNHAAIGGGIDDATGIAAWNTIIAGNRTAGSPSSPDADCALSSFTSFGYNLTTLGTGCVLIGPGDVVIASPTLVFTSVLERVLAANGSSRPTHALIERGFAVDAGYCPGEAVDQRGFPRPYDDPRMPNALDACDIGAFEWNPPDTKGKGPKP